jgi:molecular chaperone GrpE (heat shock protein)
MREEKEFLKKRFIGFQLKIAELNRTIREQEDFFQTREKELYLDLFEVLDAFENLDETIQSKESELDKTSLRMAKNIRSIHRKLLRVLKTNHIIQMEFPDKKALMEYCKVVDTMEDPDAENEKIHIVVKNGYIDKDKNRVLRKAEVITILNG